MSENQFSKEMSSKFLSLLTGFDRYISPYALSVGDPLEIALEISRKAAWKTAGISSGLSLSPSWANYLSLVPEIIIQYRIQGHLVKDIAALYGKDTNLSREAMLYCLFSGTEPSLVSSFAKDLGTRILLRPMSIELLEAFIHKLGENISKRYLRKSFRRWVPILGFGLTFGLNYTSTIRVGKNCCELFSKELLIEEAPVEKEENKEI
ncbi:MAG: hypothetical protein H7A25_02500 [Leptospiraceae bacterium]|nr:hypothetical protein [Leptospiraceae bacterium]MCP5498748.1 hypothetical protein [Leptospiraceae bacterium]